jgi:cob(I)alamin adenosyltransferase
MKLYTRQGDSGQTSLFDGRRVSKTDLRIIACGEVDELNSHLGVALSHCKHADIVDLLLGIQHLLFDLGADLATPDGMPQASKIRRVHDDQITELENEIDRATAAVPPLTQFILPSGSPLATQLQVARAVCRRAERSVVALRTIEPTVHLLTVTLLNRLSDLLFALAREANQRDGVRETFWDQGRTKVRNDQ